MKRFKNAFQSALGLSAALALAACQHEQPNFVYMPDMAYQPSIKPQEEGGGTGIPPVGTISIDGQSAYAFTDEATAGKQLKNPLKRTSEVLKRGQVVFNYTCRTCHGPLGLGDGGVVAHGYPRPPSLQSDKVRNWPDGSIYHVITKGQNLMPSYAAMVRSDDRWAVIQYIRVLQRSQHPTPEDLKAFEAKYGN